MATGSSQIGPVLAAFVVGAGVGVFIGRSTATVTPPTNFSVSVGPQALNLFPSSPVTLFRSHGDTATWGATDRSKTLFIEFTEQPFQGMQLQTNTGRYRVACLGATCNSGRDRKSTRLNSSHSRASRMPSSA